MTSLFNCKFSSIKFTTFAKAMFSIFSCCVFSNLFFLFEIKRYFILNFGMYLSWIYIWLANIWNSISRASFFIIFFWLKKHFMKKVNFFLFIHLIFKSIYILAQSPRKVAKKNKILLRSLWVLFDGVSVSNCSVWLSHQREKAMLIWEGASSIPNDSWFLSFIKIIFVILY